MGLRSFEVLASIVGMAARLTADAIARRCHLSQRGRGSGDYEYCTAGKPVGKGMNAHKGASTCSMPRYTSYEGFPYDATTRDALHVKLMVADTCKPSKCKVWAMIMPPWSHTSLEASTGKVRYM